MLEKGQGTKKPARLARALGEGFAAMSRAVGSGNETHGVFVVALDAAFREGGRRDVGEPALFW